MKEFMMLEPIMKWKNELTYELYDFIMEIRIEIGGNKHYGIV